MVDLNGNNILHISTERGHHDVSWLIINRGGKHLLDKPNNQGLLPINVDADEQRFVFI